MNERELDALIRDADPYASVRGIDLSADGQSLLEEIMLNVTPLTDRRQQRARRLKWLAAGVAAASIAVAVGIASVRPQPSDQTPPLVGPTTSPSDAPTQSPQIKFAAELIKASEQHPRYVLTAPGWTVQGVEGLTAGSGEVSYQKGERLLAISWLPASKFHAHQIARSDKGTRAQPVEVDGADGSLYDMGLAVSPDRQFFVLLPPVDGAFVEIRTTADWNRDDFLSVLGTVRSAGVTEWLSSLPADVVSSDDVPSKVDDVLRGIPLPPSFDKRQFDDLGTNDSYQFGAAVIGQAVSEWVDYWMAALKDDRRDDEHRAEQALSGAHEWPGLVAMQSKGDYPMVVWQITDAVAAGMPLPDEVSDYHAALGTR